MSSEIKVVKVFVAPSLECGLSGMMLLATPAVCILITRMLAASMVYLEPIKPQRTSHCLCWENLKSTRDIMTPMLLKERLPCVLNTINVLELVTSCYRLCLFHRYLVHTLSVPCIVLTTKKRRNNHYRKLGSLRGPNKAFFFPFCLRGSRCASTVVLGMLL